MTFSTIPDTSSRNNVDLPEPCSSNGAVPPPGPHTPHVLNGDKANARAILAAIRTLQAIEQAQRPATPDERQVLMSFPGFGPVALGIFPDPVTGRYKDATWQTLGEELRTLLAPEDYASARRTTFTAFYTSPVVIQAMHAALRHLGVPRNALVLEPGCGIGNFIALAPEDMRFIGVEQDSLSRAYRPYTAPQPRHSHRALSRYAPARGPHRRRDWQRTVRRSSARLRRHAPRAA